jgi:CBS domain-containing protein
MKVRDVMTVDVATVTPTTPLSEVARLLGERRISGAPVVEPGGRCIGIVSEGDLLAKEIGRPAPHSPLEWVFGMQEPPGLRRRREARTAGEAMTHPPITIAPDEPLRVAAERMVRDEVNRLPVVEGDRLVGIVTRADLVRAYLRLDREIEDTVRDEILRHTMWLDPADFEVESREGLVRIGGRVDRRSTARIITKLVGLVDGVAGVDGRLSWQLDDLDLEPADGEREPGAASISARERPPALHR